MTCLKLDPSATTQDKETREKSNIDTLHDDLSLETMFNSFYDDWCF